MKINLDYLFFPIWILLPSLCYCQSTSSSCVTPVTQNVLDLDRDSLISDSLIHSYTDSLRLQQNRFKWKNLFFKGYHHSNIQKHRSLTFPSGIEALQYNAVEGAVVNLEFKLEMGPELAPDFQLTPAVRYGFANKQPQARIELNKSLNRGKNEVLTIGLGRYLFQMNDQPPISALNNSFVTLAEGRNLARFYQKGFVQTAYQRKILHHLLLIGHLVYEDRTPLHNHASYNLPHKTFSPNNPVNAEVPTTAFRPNQALLMSVEVHLRFDRRNPDDDDYLIPMSSRYPELSLLYKKAVPTLGTQMNYDFLKIGFSQTLQTGAAGQSSLHVWAGTFLNHQNMTFVDFQHFNGNRTFLTLVDAPNLFELLQYYTFSTHRSYAEAHFDHHFNGFILNQVPMIQKLKLQAVISLNYLTTPAAGQYVEAGAGFEHIFKIARADVYAAYLNSSFYGWGFRLGFGL